MGWQIVCSKCNIYFYSKDMKCICFGCTEFINKHYVFSMDNIRYFKFNKSFLYFIKYNTYYKFCSSKKFEYGFEYGDKLLSITKKEYLKAQKLSCLT